MAVVDPETLERACESRCVLNHIIPKPRVVLWTGAVPKLDAITPNDDLPAEVCLGRGHGKVFEGVRVPYPAVVGQGILERVCLGFREASKVRFHEW